MSVRRSVSSVASLPLHPVVTGALLWALTRGPKSLRERLFNAAPVLRNPKLLGRIKKVLAWLLAAGVIRVANGKLNQLALNAYRTNSEKKRWNWNQEVAVVTGGCSGFGLLTVKRLILKGVKVAILDIQQLPPALHGYANISFFACDVADPEAVASTAEKIKATLGAPSILVNNAGFTHPHTILKTSPEYLRKIFDVNVLSNWYTIQDFLPDMIKQNKGHVVTVASMASYFSIGGMVDYCATKAALLCFHEGLVQEVRQRHKAPNILFTSVHPTFARTPLLEPYVAKLKDSILEPADVANAIADQILSCSGGQIYLPEDMRRGTLVRGLPNWLQELSRDGLSKAILAGTE